MTRVSGRGRARKQGGSSSTVTCKQDGRHLTGKYLWCASNSFTSVCRGLAETIVPSCLASSHHRLLRHPRFGPLTPLLELDDRHPL